MKVMSYLLLVSLLFSSCQKFGSVKIFSSEDALYTASFIQKVNQDRVQRKPANLVSDCLSLIKKVAGFNNVNSISGQHALFDLDKLEGKEYLKEMDKMIDSKDLFGLWREIRPRADELNAMTLKYLDDPLESTSSTRVANITPLQAKKTYKAVDQHPIASQCHLRKYDPQGNMGFCFGRAMTSHLELLWSGVQKDKIRKLWAVGSFQTGTSNWRYHVTTIVKSDTGEWLAIDPVMGSPITAKQWMARMKGYDVGGDMAVFTSEAKRFGPSQPEKYSNSELNRINYNDYFQDLLKSYRENKGPFSGEIFSQDLQ